MKAEDVTDTLTLALRASGCDSAKVVQRPRLLSDNGRPTCLPTWPPGYPTKAWTTPAERPATPRLRARSNDGTRR
ncbi:hypothetical protein J2S34_003825 [Nitrobacter winogradskyi]|uniref:Uncharacterized protein n=1 Tax=Nitrobacter winogradskyi TaxID=913 RepID=A0ACC6APK5_NITWI|nr:hypothetical protein [Nitrobacter winogradskyi]